MSNKDNHLSRLRTILRVSMALYVGNNEGVDDPQLMGALAATLCEAIVLREVPIDDALETTLPLVKVIGDIRDEVGIATI